METTIGQGRRVPMWWRPSRMRATAACLPMLAIGSLTSDATAQTVRRAAIIDMHLHAYHVADFGPAPAACSDNRRIEWLGWDPRKPFSIENAARCAAPLWPAPTSDSALFTQTLRALARYDILAVTSGTFSEVTRWRTAAPARVIPAVGFFRGQDSLGKPILRDLSELRALVRDGKATVFAEVDPQYRGMSPSDPALDPYFALAEELDVPIGVHMGEGPPGGRHVESYEQYRVALGNPMLLEEVLVRHPRLRLYVMHFGSPFVDEMIALMFSYPQVYVDVAQNNWGFPRAHFHSQLKRLVDAGFGKRILFGSDQMVWPQTIGLAIETIESAPFLSASQKRDILHDNAARFLRLP